MCNVYIYTLRDVLKVVYHMKDVLLDRTETDENVDNL